jgi:uncharacterized protein (DUF362 family)
MIAPHPRVAISGGAHIGYPARPPYDPPERYPELPPGRPAIDPGNAVYASVRRAFALLGLDAARQGTSAWNPLGDLIRPGDRVLVKPNLVRHFHGDDRGLEALVTHPSVVRAVLDYAALALRGEGSIVVGDAPLQYADFAATLASTGLDLVLEESRRHAGVPVRAIDFRRERSEKRGGLIVSRLPNEGDPEGYRVVELGAASRFAGVPEARQRRFRVTQYDPRTMRDAHHEGRHAYLLPASVLRADVVLNLPKLKTHRKAGITAAMKNLVGINGSKDWLPHHTAGGLPGGDEYLRPSARKAIMSRVRDIIEGRRSARSRRLLRAVERTVRATGRLRAFPDPYWEGSWHGNDTVWRMVHDLHRVLLHADADGVLHEEPRRRYLALVDAVVAGEGEGPMRPTPRPTGLIVAGTSPAAVDTVCCRLMGFDEGRIPLLREAVDIPGGVPRGARIEVASDDPAWQDLFSLPPERTLRFAPPAGWRGCIELGARREAAPAGRGRT